MISDPLLTDPLLRVSRLTETDWNVPKRTYENTETYFCGYRNGPERTSVGTETDRNRLQLKPKRTSIGTKKGRVGYHRNDPNKIMYVWVGRYVGRYACMYVNR